MRVDSLNALNDPAKQLAQAEAELAKGAKVLIVAAIDQKSFAVAVKKARAQGVPTIAYDRLIRNAPLGVLRLVQQRDGRQDRGRLDGEEHEEGRPPRDHQRLADG